MLMQFNQMKLSRINRCREKTLETYVSVYTQGLIDSSSHAALLVPVRYRSFRINAEIVQKSTVT